MLVLSRKQDESISIVDRETGATLVSMKVIQIGPNKVRIGFDAEYKYAILRGELMEVK